MRLRRRRALKPRLALGMVDSPGPGLGTGAGARQFHPDPWTELEADVYDGAGAGSSPVGQDLLHLALLGVVHHRGAARLALVLVTPPGEQVRELRLLVLDTPGGGDLE